MTTNRRLATLLLAMGGCLLPGFVLAATPAAAAPPAASPMFVERRSAPVHRFLDARNLSLQSVSLVMLAADVASTHRALRVPGTHEINPLSGSEGSLISLKLAGAGAGQGISYLLHRTGHHSAERLVPALLGIPSGIAAAHNAGIHR